MTSKRAMRGFPSQGAGFFATSRRKDNARHFLYDLEA